MNFINGQTPSKTIFVIMENTQTKRNLDVFTINQSYKKTKIVQNPISFSDNDLEGVELPHQDPLVITTNINDYPVHRHWSFDRHLILEYI